MIKGQKYQLIFQPVLLSNVTICDSFWLPRLETNRTVSLFHQYQQLLKYGALENFKRAAGEGSRNFTGLYFSDSDVYKWLEASSYSLKTHWDSRLKSIVDEVISLITAAQEPNGYLNTYFQLVEPDKKFTNLGVCHELYTAGHLIGAAVAHYHATGESSLLSTACRLANHIAAIFGPGKLEAVDGHAGIEMALIALYRVTDNLSYLNLAQYFIDQRGRSDSRLRWELAHLDEIGGKLGKPGQHNRKFFGSYEAYDGRHAQDHLPVREQTEATGHAVRGMFLFCGMADLAVETGDRRLIAALERIWRHLTTRRLYITGGIGSARANEGFTRDYDLPNDTACAECCAAVGMVLWNYRMLNITGEGRYADLMERVLYNAFLVGVSLDGTKYFYNNPLQSNGDHHRQEWYECACCPPNIARLLASLAGYVYSKFETGLAVNLYVQSSVVVDLENGVTFKFSQATNYPWDGHIRCRLEIPKPVRLELRLRIPDWCRFYTLKVNQKSVKAKVHKGYAVIERLWSPGDCLELNLSMRIERIVAYPEVSQAAGKVALQRGPLIYALESCDNAFPVEQLILLKNSRLRSRFIKELCGGVTVIEGMGLIPEQTGWEGTLYRWGETAQRYSKVMFRAVPYYLWDNRQPGKMIVWINRC